MIWHGDQDRPISLGHHFHVYADGDQDLFVGQSSDHKGDIDKVFLCCVYCVRVSVNLMKLRKNAHKNCIYMAALQCVFVDAE